MNYGERLKELREYSNIKKKISQREVAKFLGLKRSAYNQYEQQYDILPSKHLNNLANFFNVSIDYILCLSDIPNYKNSKTETNLELTKKRLKELRKSNKLTQTNLANILQTVQPVIANYEKGKFPIATPFLYDLCTKFNISADYLLGRIDYNPLKKINNK